MTRRFFTRKQITLEAIPVDGNNLSEIIFFCGNCIHDVNYTVDGDYTWLMLQSGSSVVKVSVGNWIVRGIDGIYYAIPNDVFNQLYEQRYTFNVG